MSDLFGVLVNLSPYYGLEEGMAWIEALKNRAEHEGVSYLLALPFDVLNKTASAPAPSFLIFGSAHMNAIASGTFTESIASKLLANVGAKFVLLGTRRDRKAGETSITIREKIIKAKAEGVTPILCIGENEEEHRQEQSATVLTRQVGEATRDLSAAELSGLHVVYEAPWIQETASIPSEDEIDHAYQFCRDLVHSLFGDPLASSVKVYCAVPSDHKEVEKFIHTLHADGFYFVDPHQLTALDEETLHAKAEKARQAKEAAAPSPQAGVEAKEADSKKGEAEEISTTAKTMKEADSKEGGVSTAAETMKEAVKVLEEAETGGEAKAVSSAPSVKEENEAATQSEKEENEAATEPVKEDAAADSDVAISEETESVEETEELQAEEPPVVEEEVAQPTEAAAIAEPLPEEKPEEVKDYAVSDISKPVAEVKRKRGRPKKNPDI